MLILLLKVAALFASLAMLAAPPIIDTIMR